MGRTERSFASQLLSTPTCSSSLSRFSLFHVDLQQALEDVLTLVSAFFARLLLVVLSPPAYPGRQIVRIVTFTSSGQVDATFTASTDIIPLTFSHLGSLLLDGTVSMAWLMIPLSLAESCRDGGSR